MSVLVLEATEHRSYINSRTSFDILSMPGKENETNPTAEVEV